MAKEVEKEYLSSLKDLAFNCKPLINMLTLLAEENAANAPVIVQTIEKHLVQTEHKLPCLYLIDSILKNVGKQYLQLFTQNIVSTFAGVFEKVDEKVRSSMFRLRQTWSGVFPAKKLYAIDLRVSTIDPAWPIMPASKKTIHINPKVFKKRSAAAAGGTPAAALPTAASPAALDLISEKQMELLNLQIQKVELELQCAATQPEQLVKQKELLELRTEKAQLELQQATNKLKSTKAAAAYTATATTATKAKSTSVYTTATSSTASAQLPASPEAESPPAAASPSPPPSPPPRARSHHSSRHKSKVDTPLPSAPVCRGWCWAGAGLVLVLGWHWCWC